MSEVEILRADNIRLRAALTALVSEARFVRWPGGYDIFVDRERLEALRELARGPIAEPVSPNEPEIAGCGCPRSFVDSNLHHSWCKSESARPVEPGQCKATTGPARVRCEWEAGHRGQHMAQGITSTVTWSDEPAMRTEPKGETR